MTIVYNIKLLLAILILGFSLAAIEWLDNQPQDVGMDVPAGKLRSLSFAPYHEGFTPVEEKYPLPEHIDEDLKVLADKTHTIRTYSILGGMKPTPEFARKHGIEMLQGGWLGNGPDGNTKEIAALIKAVNANPDVIKRVIVGNEVLLRKDMPINSLIGYIRQVKQAVKQPVSYADVWSIYLQYPQLFNEVDFITIHILPYWEDEPVAIEHAAAHVENIVKQIEEKARSMGVNKPILIGESGWPAVGRQRGEAIPSIVNQTRFIRSIIEVANRHGYDYNIVEAFNQPWKSGNEGVVGANWGLLSIDREPIVPLTGPVSDNPHWQKSLLMAMALWLIISAAFYKKAQCLSLSRLMLFLITAQIFSLSLIDLIEHEWITSYSRWQQGYTVSVVLANIALAALVLQRCYIILAEQAHSLRLANFLKKGYLAFMLLALIKTYSLAFNGRYLSFPVEQCMLPALGILALMVCKGLADGRLSLSFQSLIGETDLSPKYQLLAKSLGLGVFGVVLGETYMYMASHDFIEAHPSFFEGLPVALSYSIYNLQLIEWLLCISVLSTTLWKADNRNLNV